MLVLPLGCGLTPVGAFPEIEIKRAGVLAPGGPTVTNLYWTNDKQVLFIGAKPGLVDVLPDGRRSPKQFLMEWNTATGEVKPLAELGEYANLCYAGGYVRYQFRRGNGFVVRAGLLGNERDIASSINERNRSIRLNPFTCREYDEQQLQSATGLRVWPLHDGHGYWAAREDRKQTESVLIKLKNGEREETALNIPYHPPPFWSEYAQVYFFKWSEGRFSNAKTGAKLWLLTPNVHTQEVDIPAGPWLAGSTGYGITKRGVFMYSHALGHLAVGDAGGYLIEQRSRPKRFIEGYVLAFGISPEGCKIAMSISSYPPRDFGEMVVADICAQGK